MRGFVPHSWGPSPPRYNLSRRALWALPGPKPLAYFEVVAGADVLGAAVEGLEVLGAGADAAGAGAGLAGAGVEVLGMGFAAVCMPSG